MFQHNMLGNVAHPLGYLTDHNDEGSGSRNGGGVSRGVSLSAT